MKARTRLCAAAAIGLLLAALPGCRQSGEGMQVFVGLPQPGEGWVWQTFQPPADTSAPRGDTISLAADFALMTYGNERTVKVVVARCYPDHSGIEEPFATAWKTFTSDLSDSTRVSYNFGDVVLTPRGETPFAFYFFVEGPVTCDIVVERTDSLADGCFYVQDRFERDPEPIGRALFNARAE